MSGCSVAELSVPPTSNSGGAANDAEDSFEQKRKQHYKVDLRALKAAAMDDEDEDDEEDDDNEVKKAEIPESEARDFGGGHWAIGPEELHGGPKVGSGFAQSTGGSANAALAFAATAESASACSAAGTAGQLMPVLPGCVPSPEVHSQAATSTSAGTQLTPRSKKVLTWDEETIAEHDLERGTRQKIEEPNTPWMGSPSTSAHESAIHSSTPAAQPEDDDAQPIDASATPLVEEEVQDKLRNWFHKERHRVSIQEQWGTPEEPSTADLALDELSLEEKKARDFAAKRAQHYKVDLKAMRAQEESEDEEDESDEDE